MTTQTTAAAPTYTALDNPFERRIVIVDGTETVVTYTDWAAAAIWYEIADEATTDEQGIEGFAATARPTPAIIPVWALPADTRYIKGACE